MKRVIVLIVAVVAIAAAVNLLKTSDAEACGGGYAIVDVSLIPMTIDGVLDHQTVIVTGDEISAVGPTSDVSVPDGLCVIDGQGQYLMPGLSDAHAHLFDDGDLSLYLTHGVTSILNMSGSYQHLWMRDALLAGELDGPALYTTGPMVKMDAQPIVEFEDNPLNEEFASELVRRHHAAGYDFLKVWGTFDPAIYASMMDTARELDFPVTGHIARAVGLQGILDQGQISIAHVEELFSRHFNDAPTPEGIAEVTQLLAGRDVTVTTTLVTYEAIASSIAEDITPLMTREGSAYMDPARLGMWGPGGNRFRNQSRLGRDAHYLSQMAEMQEITRALSEGGVRLLAGVDAGELPGLVPGFDLHRELELMVGAGMSNQTVLRSATQNFGAYLNNMNVEVDRMGEISVGARADLLLLSANPLDDISNTRAISAVMTRGAYYDQTALNELISSLAARNAATGQYFGALMSGGIEAGAEHIASWEHEDVPPFGYFSSVFFSIGQAMQGDPVGAEATLKQITGVFPDRTETWFLLGGLRAMMGNPTEALEAYDQALVIAPDHERVQRDRAILVQSMATAN